MSYVRLINQCGLYEDKIRIFLKNGACGLYTGALNRPKITVAGERKKKKKKDQIVQTYQILFKSTGKLVS